MSTLESLINGRHQINAGPGIFVITRGSLERKNYGFPARQKEVISLQEIRNYSRRSLS